MIGLRKESGSQGSTSMWESVEGAKAREAGGGAGCERDQQKRSRDGEAAESTEASEQSNRRAPK